MPLKLFIKEKKQIVLKYLEREQVGESDTSIALKNIFFLFLKYSTSFPKIPNVPAQNLTGFRIF